MPSLRLNAALFTTSYDDIQLIYRLGIVPLLFNAGTATIKGAELEMIFSPTPEFVMEGGFSFLHDTIDQITEVPGTTATVGPENSLPFTPEWQANIGAAYTFHVTSGLDVTPRMDLSYTSSFFFDAANTVEVAQDDYAVLNMSIALENAERTWAVRLSVENLTDERYLLAGNASLTTATGYAEVIFARPRNVFVTASYDF